MFSDPEVAKLAKAAARGDVSTIDKLVDAGVDVNAKGEDGMTPLIFAYRKNSKKGFLRLLERGADPNAQDRKGNSAISLAASDKEDSEWLKMVLKHGGNPNLVDEIDSLDFLRGATPLSNAAESKNLENVELLIQAKANLDHQDQAGMTAMMRAASFRWYVAVDTLLRAGADWRPKRKKESGGQNLAFICLEYKPSRKDYPKEYEYWERVLAFLKAKGVDLEATQRAVDKHLGKR